MELDPAQEDQVFLSTMRAGPAQRRYALVVVVVSIVVFLAAAPFVRVQLPPSPAFISNSRIGPARHQPDYGGSIIWPVRDLALARDAGVGRRVIPTAVMTVACARFPRRVYPDRPMGGGPQASAWLYVFWRIGYELSLIAYIVMSSRTPASPVRSASVAIVSSIVIVVALTCLLTLFATQAYGILPALQNDGRYTRTTLVTAIVSLSLGLLFLLWFWRRGAKSVLDLWLLVVIFMILLSAVLSAVLNTGRFDFSFVFGRLFGLAAASFVLINLLIQNSRLYAKLAAGQAELQRLTRVDPLTGIANRRAFDLAIETNASGHAQPDELVIAVGRR